MWKTAAYRGTLAISDIYVQEQNMRLLLSLSFSMGHFTAGMHLGEESHFIKQTHYPGAAVSLPFVPRPDRSIAVMFRVGRAAGYGHLNKQNKNPILSWKEFGAATTGNFFSKWQWLWSWLGLQAEMHVLIETGSCASTELTVLEFRYCNRATV